MEGAESSRVAPREQLCEESLLNLLGLLNDFSRIDASGRAIIYEQVSTTAVLEPTAANRLTLAILKAMPGHHGYNLESAQTLLNAVLNDSSMLSTGIANFTRVYARAIAEQQKLVQRNRQLRAELTEAHDKLQALTEIEREVELPPPGIEEPELHHQSQPESNMESSSHPALKHDNEPQKNSASR